MHLNVNDKWRGDSHEHLIYYYMLAQYQLLN